MWLLEQLQKTGKLPQIIFTTAYTDPGYLLKAIKFSATDYLNKPISIVELAQAVEKAKKRIQEEKEIKQASQKKYFRSAHSIHSLSHRMMISSLLKLMVIMHKYNCSTAKRS
jgi:YesN/AraC family two-component response regulator